jgi:hypothetical protein
MNDRRVLDANHLYRTLLRVARAYVRDRARRYGLSTAALTLPIRDIDNGTIKIDTGRIERLAEQLRVVTAIEASQTIEDLARLLAQIALVVNYSVSAMGDDRPMSVAHKMSTNYAFECAAEYARVHHYAIDLTKIPEERAVIALMTNDDRMLSRIFHESLEIAGRTAGTGRHALRTSPGSIRPDPDLLRQLEDQTAASTTLNSQPLPEVERQLSAPAYWNMRSNAAMEGWSVHEVLMLIEEHLSSAKARQRHWFVEADGDRHLSAQAYSNLRSTASLRGWSVYEILLLIEEHLSPALIPQLAHYSNTESGTDWERLHAWILPPGGKL